jgi:hypothetical protein
MSWCVWGEVDQRKNGLDHVRLLPAKHLHYYHFKQRSLLKASNKLTKLHYAYIIEEGWGVHGKEQSIYDRSFVDKYR